MMFSTAYILVLITPLVVFAVWHLTSTLAPPAPPLLRNKRIILLIAHPDDESMFFSPTLQALTDPALQNHVKILCLSTGNADGLGDVRKRELETAAVTLGVRRREDVFVLDDEKRFKDGMDEDWSDQEIARVLASAFAPQLNGPSSQPPPSTVSANEKKETAPSNGTIKPDRKSSSKSKKPSSKSTPPVLSPAAPPFNDTDASQLGPRATIDVLITFDDNGISSHPNHISLYRGAHTFIRNLMRGHSGYSCPVTLYTLTTINMLRKYSFILDAVPTLISGVLSSSSSSSSSSPSGARSTSGDNKVLFVSDVFKYWRAREAMVSGHKSQMVWFRWGWIGIGRYMVINDLRKERVVPGT